MKNQPYLNEFEKSQKKSQKKIIGLEVINKSSVNKMYKKIVLIVKRKVQLTAWDH